MTDEHKPEQPEEHDAETITAKGIGGIEFSAPVRRSDMRWLIYSASVALIILAVFFGLSLIK